MRIYVNVKQAGSRKNHITKEEIVLPKPPASLRVLIGEIVTQNVEKYNQKVGKESILDFITDEELEGQAKVGKVGFGEVYSENKAKLDQALDAAWLAYEDGIYRVFVGGREAGGLDDAITLNEDDVLTFIRLTMLAGRLW